MNEISWDLFRTKNPNSTKSFQDLSKALFARKLGVRVSELLEYHDQKGIEVEPKSGYSFQSKFNRKDQVSWSEFKHSLRETTQEFVKDYPSLKTIYFYTNGLSKKKNNTRDEIDKIAKSNGINIEWIYGLNILELIKEDQNQDLRKKFFGGGENLKISTTEINSTHSKNLSSLKYQYQITSFRGRSNEIDELMDFAHHDDLIKWWVIEGRAGVGKSRLSLHYANSLKAKGWHCGFFSSFEENGFDSWNPEKPHLIICDYVLGREKEVVKGIKKAIQLNKDLQLDFKVRFLLIERSGQQEIQNLNTEPSFGPLIESYQYSNAKGDSSMLLNLLSEIDTIELIKEVALFFGLSKDETSDVLLKLSNSNQPNSFIFGSLLCLFKYNKLTEFDTLDTRSVIEILLKREESNWLEKLKISEEGVDLLVLASLTGGLNFEKLKSLELAKNLIDIDLKEMYSKIVGAKVTTYLPALSHDLVNELYVLNSINERNRFNYILKLGLSYEQGEGLVSFFTRAANDFERHPSLQYLMTPFSNAGLRSLIWLSIIANTIDKIDVEIDKKITLFHHLIYDLYNHAKELITSHTPFLDNIFIRILNELSGNNSLDKWVLEYKLLYLKKEEVSFNHNVEPSINHLEREPLDIGAGIRVKLRQKEYCDAIIETYRKLNSKVKLKLVSPQLLEIFSHYSIHLLSSRKAGSSKIQLIVNELNDNLSEKYANSLSRLYQDIIVGLFQWGYVHKESEFSSKVTLEMLSILEAKTIDNSSAPCYSAASNVIANTIREFDAKKDILERFKRKFSNIYSDEILSSHFIGICVSLMYRFKTKEDYNYALMINKKSHFLTEKYHTKNNVLNLTYGTTQLLSYRGEYITKQEKNRIWKSCINISKKYAKINQEIIQKVLNELVSEIDHLIKLNDGTVPKKLDQVKKFLNHYKKFDLDKLLYVGGFLKQYFEYYLENNDLINLKTCVDYIDMCNKFDSFELTYMWNPLHQNFSAKFQSDRNESKSLKIFKEIAPYWLLKNINSHMDWSMKQIINEI